jgi:hypothetical protein
MRARTLQLGGSQHLHEDLGILVSMTAYVLLPVSIFVWLLESIRIGGTVFLGGYLDAYFRDVGYLGILDSSGRLWLTLNKGVAFAWT